jgi:hypothetical protein
VFIRSAYSRSSPVLCGLTLPAAQTKVEGLIVNSEFERMWKGVIMAWFEIIFQNLPEVTSVTTTELRGSGLSQRRSRFLRSLGVWRRDTGWSVPGVSRQRLCPFDPWKWDRYAVAKRLALISQWHGTISRKNEDFTKKSGEDSAQPV